MSGRPINGPGSAGRIRADLIYRQLAQQNVTADQAMKTIATPLDAITDKVISYLDELELHEWTKEHWTAYLALLKNKPAIPKLESKPSQQMSTEDLLACASGNRSIQPSSPDNN